MLRHDKNLAQIPLFGGSDGMPSTRSARLAATVDPISSHMAAVKVTASGQRDSTKRDILAALSAQSGPVTSAELARTGGFDRYVAARRIPDLERDDLVERGPMRKCVVSGRPVIIRRAKDGR